MCARFRANGDYCNDKHAPLNTNYKKNFEKEQEKIKKEIYSVKESGG